MTPQDQNIPYGFCHCGCGQQTSLSKQARRSRGLKTGTPSKFLVGHQKRIRPLPEDAAPFRIVSVEFPAGIYCRLIPLTQGQYAIVWESDYRWLMQWKWCVKWSKELNGYYVHRHELSKQGHKVSVTMHRQIMGLAPGDGRIVDHKNGVSLDMRRDNLRFANVSQNIRNSKKYSNNSSGYKGVSYDQASRKWRARIMVNGKSKHLGFFNTREEAYAAYCKAAVFYFGEFARLA